VERGEPDVVAVELATGRTLELGRGRHRARGQTDLREIGEIRAPGQAEVRGPRRLVVSVLPVVVVDGQLARPRERGPLEPLVGVLLAGRLVDDRPLTRIARADERAPTVRGDLQEDLVGARSGRLHAGVGRVAVGREAGGHATVARVRVRVDVGA